MNRKAMEHIINSHFRKIKYVLSCIDHNPETEYIHDFRVQVKKMRAFLRLLSCELILNEDLKLPGKLKKIYDATGKLRNLQLQKDRVRQMSEDAGAVTDYLDIIQIQINKKSKTVQELARNYPAGKQKNRIFRTIPPESHIQSISRFLDQQKAGIINLLNPVTLTIPGFHNIRKILKDCIFIMKLAIDGGLASPFYWNESEMDKAVSLEQSLGVYHDHCIATDLLKFILEGNAKKNCRQPSSIWRINWKKTGLLWSSTSGPLIFKLPLHPFSELITILPYPEKPGY